MTDDKILEEKEIFIVTLNVTRNGKEVVVGEQDSVMVIIEDNDCKYIIILQLRLYIMYVCLHVCICVYACVCVCVL